MKFRSTWILAGIVVAFGAYLYFGEYKKAAKEEADKAANEKVLDIDQAKVTVMEIKNDNGDFIVRKEDKAWQLVSPLKDSADENMISGILNALTSSKFEQAIEGETDLKKFGLDKPKSFVMLTMQDGTVKKVNVGSDSPIQGKIYLQRDGENKVLFADAGFKTQLDRSLKDVRDKKIFRKSKNDIQAISLKYNLKDNQALIKLVKKGTDWEFQGDKNKKADQDVTNGFINGIDNLRATDFPSEKSDDVADLKKFGLDKPAATIKLEDKDQKLLAEITVSPKKDNNVFIKVNGEKPIYQAFGGGSDQLIHTPADFQDKKEPFNIKKDDINEIILSSGSTNEHLIKSGINWELAVPDPKKEVSQIQVANFLDKVATLRVSEFLNEPAKGLNSPAGTVTLKDNKKQTLLTFSWGDVTKSKRSYFTKSDKVGFVFGTDTTSLNGLVSQPLISDKVAANDPKRVTETNRENPQGPGKPLVAPSPGAVPSSPPAKPEVIDLKSEPATK